MNDDEIVQNILNAKTLYGVLGIDKTADSASLKSAYRKIASRVHPDRNHHPKATEAFQRLSHAYQTLSDPEKRKIYDFTGQENLRASLSGGYGTKGNYQYAQEISPEDLFNMFFGNGMFFVPQTHIRRNYRRAQPNDVIELKSHLIKIIFILIIFILPNILPLLTNFSSIFTSLKKEDTREVIYFDIPHDFNYETFKSSKFAETFYVPTWWIKEKFNNQPRNVQSKLQAKLKEYADEFLIEELGIKCEIEKNTNMTKKNNCKKFYKLVNS